MCSRAGRNSPKAEADFEQKVAEDAEAESMPTSTPPNGGLLLSWGHGSEKPKRARRYKIVAIVLAVILLYVLAYGPAV